MDTFSNSLIQMNDLPEYQEVHLNPISKKYKKVILFNLILSYSIILSGLIFFFYFSEKQLFLALRIAIVGIVFVFMAGYTVFTLLAFKRKAFAFREQDAIFRSGILSEIQVIVPYNRLQHVIVKQGWLSRTLGLSTIRMYTAGSSGELAIPGIEKAKAESIKNLLLHKINETELKDSENTATDKKEVHERED